MKLYCCGCGTDVNASLTSGEDVYPHRLDLSELPFWQCDACGNYVGCHHKTKDRTKPLGCIPTPEIRAIRNRIHRTADQIWRDGKMSRKDMYAAISRKIGREYHTANIRSAEEAREIYGIVQSLAEHP